MNDADLLRYLDEALPAAEMAAIEQQLRTSDSLRQRLIQISSERDSGAHSLGDVWRRNQLSCPGRERLGTYLLGALEEGEAGYIRFHLEVVGCRHCQANLADLLAQNSPEPVRAARRSRYFQSSAGRLRAR